MRWLDTIRLRLRSLFRRRQADTELAQELALHLEEETRDLIARGRSPREAALTARRSFGSVAATADACRDTRRVAILLHLVDDLRQGLRSLAKQPLLVLAAVASTAVGVGANTLIAEPGDGAAAHRAHGACARGAR